MAFGAGGNLDPGSTLGEAVSRARFVRRTPVGHGSGARHHPDARRLRLDWRRDDARGWVSDREDERLWEVSCPQCGDTDGPQEYRPPTVRALCGPYRSRRAARRAARRHVRRFA
jgi:hypothetical protein